jgi:Fic family protein
MAWNWQQPDWPQFTYDSAALQPLEHRFLLRSGEFIGAFEHIGPDDRDGLKIELISTEALKTSEIEGEILDRDSVQASLPRCVSSSVSATISSACRRPSAASLR